VADLVAAVSVKTPTAVAVYLKEEAGAFDGWLEERLDELSGAALTLLDNSRQQLRQAAVTLKMGSSDRMHDQQLQLGRLHGDLIRLTGQVVYRGLADLRNLDVRLSQASRYNLAACTQNLDAMQGVLALRSTELLQTQRQQLAWLGDRVAARDPRRMLEMGFAMVRSGGRHITSVGDVQPGVEITVLWRDGSADAEIKRLHPTGKSSRKENDKLK
jgi:exodeoxyribonuclease VII large subunit